MGESGPYSDKEVKNAVAIVGLTSLGKQQEVIDFPREIDGKPVCYISYRDWSSVADRYYEFESEKLKKVYIHENIKYVYRDAFSGITDSCNLEIMFCATKDPYVIFDDSIYQNSEVYLYKSVYAQSIFIDNMHAANIVFLDNYSVVENEGYYSLDNVESGEKIPVPSNPVRNGYEFTGWYTEAECINKWDFGVAPDIEEGTEIRLYASWRVL